MRVTNRLPLFMRLFVRPGTLLGILWVYLMIDLSYGRLDASETALLADWWRTGPQPAPLERAALRFGALVPWLLGMVSTSMLASVTRRGFSWHVPGLRAHLHRGLIHMGITAIVIAGVLGIWIGGASVGALVLALAPTWYLIGVWGPNAAVGRGVALALSQAPLLLALTLFYGWNWYEDTVLAAPLPILVVALAGAGWMLLRFDVNDHARSTIALDPTVPFMERLRSGRPAGEQQVRHWTTPLATGRAVTWLRALHYERHGLGMRAYFPVGIATALALLSYLLGVPLPGLYVMLIVAVSRAGHVAVARPISRRSHARLVFARGVVMDTLIPLGAAAITYAVLQQFDAPRLDRAREFAPLGDARWPIALAITMALMPVMQWVDLAGVTQTVGRVVAALLMIFTNLATFSFAFLSTEPMRTTHARELLVVAGIGIGIHVLHYLALHHYFTRRDLTVRASPA